MVRATPPFGFSQGIAHGRYLSLQRFARTVYPEGDGQRARRGIELLVKGLLYPGDAMQPVAAQVAEQMRGQNIALVADRYRVDGQGRPREGAPYRAG